MRIRDDRRAAAFALTLATLVLWPIGSAADTPLQKAGRALAALTTPFLEIPGNIVETDEEHGPIRAWTEGLARGIGMSIVRPSVGVYELVTAPFAVPKDYEPILYPEYPWGYFGQGETRRSLASR